MLTFMIISDSLSVVRIIIGADRDKFVDLLMPNAYLLKNQEQK